MSVATHVLPVPGAGGYVRPTWRQAMAEYLPAHRRGPAADRWIDRLPILLVLVVSAALSLRLQNTAYVAEAHAITVGHDYLVSWFGGAPAVDHWGNFSGVPVLYPVLAAVLDGLGGLPLVRLFSLACMLATTVVLQSLIRRVTGSYRHGLLAACTFAFTAPTVFVGALATPDALCLLLLVVAARIGLTARSAASGVTAGVLLVVTVALNYPTVIVVGALLVLALLVPSPTDGRSTLRRAQPGVVFALLGGVGAAVCLTIDDGFRPAFVNALSPETPINPESPATLVGWMVLSLAWTIALAIGGTGAAMRSARSADARSAALTPLVVGLALPLAQAGAGEGYRFHEQGAYAALFLAPASGRALVALSQRLFRLVPVVVILLLALVPAASRSVSVYASWADVTPVLADVDAHPQPGHYLSPASETLAYYTRDDGRIVWDSASTLYLRGDAATRGAVVQRAYQVIVLRSKSTAEPDQQALLAALTVSPDYELDPVDPAVAPDDDHWVVYRLVNTVP